MPRFFQSCRSLCEVMGGTCRATTAGIMSMCTCSTFKLRRGSYRLVYLSDVIVEHLHHEAGKAGFDETYHKPMADDELSISPGRDVGCRPLASGPYSGISMKTETLRLERGLKLSIILLDGWSCTAYILDCLARRDLPGINMKSSGSNITSNCPHASKAG